MRADIVLVSMPWCSLYNPSIQIGVLASALREAGFDAECRSYQLDFFDWLASQSRGEGALFAASDYLELSVNHFSKGMGDWCFAGVAFGDDQRSPDPGYLEWLRTAGVDPTVVDKMRFARHRTAAFIERCTEDLLAVSPRVVGFTTGFQQTVASLALSMSLKARDPDIRIVFGGADCDGVMGEGLIRAFPCIDAVVRGEGERAIVSLVGDFLAPCPVRPVPGLCFRDDASVKIVSRCATGHNPPDDIPIPDFDDFFARLRASHHRGEIEPAVEIPIESSRGCWWGEKHHCTFCGFNGAEMAFRAKSPARFLDEVNALAKRHKCHSFMATDAIIDPRYFSTVLPELARDPNDMVFFYETKANLKEAQVALLRKAGVLHLQPGIESLSTPILRMIKKGTSAIQNIRLLKWCRQHGINVLWNVIYGFPHEQPEDYDTMRRLVPRLTHLQPPSLVPLVLDRFSPYQMAPEAYGLEITGPPSHYDWTMPGNPEVRAEWPNLCYRFEYRHRDGRDPEQYVAGLRGAIKRWQHDFSWTKPALRYRRGPGFMTIVDERVDFPAAHYRLEQATAEVYLACKEGTSPAAVVRKLGLGKPTESDVRAKLVELTERGLMVEEDGIYLSLAIPVASLDIPFAATI